MDSHRALARAGIATSTRRAEGIYCSRGGSCGAREDYAERTTLSDGLVEGRTRWQLLIVIVACA
jgi:hypothetical protein